jgi:hypothetical protein
MISGVAYFLLEPNKYFYHSNSFLPQGSRMSSIGWTIRVFPTG